MCHGLACKINRLFYQCPFYLKLYILVLFYLHRGGSMRITILPWAIILTKTHRAAVSMMAKGSIVT